MAGNIIVSLLSAFDDKGIKDAEKAFGALTGKLKGVGRNLAMSVGSALVGAQAVSFVKDSATAAMEFQKAMAGVNSVYGAYTSKVQSFIQSSEKIGMSHAEAARNVTFLGSVFKKTGIPMDEVINKTETLVSLSADLASTYGGTVEEAMTGISAMFRGEYDPIEKFGVAMKQNQVNALLAARGQDQLTGSAQIAAATLARYDLLMQNSTDAQGAFARQTGNLFEQQQILSAEWTDMQQTLGEKLIPALTIMAEKMKPIIERVAPKMIDVFVSISDTLMALAPILPQLGTIVSAAFTTLGAILKAVSPMLVGLVNFISGHIASIATFVGVLMTLKNFGSIKDTIQLTVYALGYLIEDLKKTKNAQIAFNLAADANPYILAASAIALGVAAIVEGYNALSKQAEKVKKEIQTLPVDVIKEANRAAKQASADAEKLAPGMADPGLAAKTAWQDAIDKYLEYKRYISSPNIANAAKAQMAEWNILQATADKTLAASQLKKLGASADFIKSVLAKSNWSAEVGKLLRSGKSGIVQAIAQWTGSTTKAVTTWFDTLAEEFKKQAKRLKLQKLGLSTALIDSVLNASDWESAVSKIVKMTSTQLKSLEKQFDATAAGQAAIAAAAKDLADRQQQYVDAVQKRIDAINTLMSATAQIMPKTYAEITAQLGQFESDVVSATANLKDSLKSALDNKDITTAAYNNLISYVERESAAMQKLAAERDAVVAKIEAAKTVYLEVANAVRGYGNVTAQTTEQITESYTKLIDGVEVTVTRTVDALQSGDIVGAYKKIVDKTKAFYQNLVNLKRMGLNSTLFKQIIDAGVDAGAVTADAIVNGGQDTVSSLNDLFNQLDATGAQMGDLTAQVMQDSGVKIVSSFIDSLTSQEADLADKAKSLAQTFSDAFNNAVKLAIPQVDYTQFGLTAAQAADALAKAGLPADQGGAGNPAENPITPPVIPPVVPLPTISFSAWDSMSPEMQAKYQPVVNTSGVSQVGVNGAGNSIASNYGVGAGGATLGGTPINLTVNAGLGTDGNAVGLTIVQVLKQYERNNGAIWQAV